MKTKVKMSLASIVLSMAMVIGAMAVPFANTEKVQAAEVVDMGKWYVAEGQPKVFRDRKAEKIEVISAAGNKYKVSKNTITITCKKSGLIKYKANGEDKQFYLKIGGNGKDSKVKKSEYKMASHTVNKKKYTNFIDGAVAYMGKKVNVCYSTSSEEKDVNAASKYNRGIKYGDSLDTIKKKYPSWQDVIFYNNDTCCFVGLYYDKKTKVVVQKGFILDDNYKVTGVMQRACIVKSEEDIAKLEKKMADGKYMFWIQSDITSNSPSRPDYEYYIEWVFGTVSNGTFKIGNVYVNSTNDPYFTDDEGEQSSMSTEDMDEHYGDSLGETMRNYMVQMFNDYLPEINDDMVFAGDVSGFKMYVMGVNFMTFKEDGNDSVEYIWYPVKPDIATE